MQRLEVSGVVRPIYGSLGVKRLSWVQDKCPMDTLSVLRNALSIFQKKKL